MLVLSRRVGEQIQIGDNIMITLTSVDGHRVRLGIQAPQHVPIIRTELLDGISRADAEEYPAVTAASA